MTMTRSLVPTTPMMIADLARAEGWDGVLDLDQVAAGAEGEMLDHAGEPCSWHDLLRAAQAILDEAATIDEDAIRSLRSEAGAAGDMDMVAVCDAALDGVDSARLTCVRIILDTRAHTDE